MPIDSIATRQAWINHKRRQAIAQYEQTWQNLTQDWQVDSSQDAAWLTYSANYLLRTAGIRWALDPFSLYTRLGGGVQPPFAQDLAKLQLVVLSHAHNDHFDPELLSGIANLPLIWVVPDFMRSHLNTICSLPGERVMTPQPGVPMTFGALMLTPFNALHIRGKNGVPEIGYLAEFNGKRWLFPGDTRNYDFSALPDFGRLDGVFAHLWLGKAEAAEQASSQMENFCRFFAAFDTRRLVITHLYELDRDARDCWIRSHYTTVKRRLVQLKPQLEVSCALMGQKICL